MRGKPNPNLTVMHCPYVELKYAHRICASAGAGCSEHFCIRNTCSYYANCPRYKTAEAARKYLEVECKDRLTNTAKSADKL